MAIRFVFGWILGFLILGTTSLLCVSSGDAMERVCGPFLIVLSVGGSFAILVGNTVVVALATLAGWLLGDWSEAPRQWRYLPPLCLAFSFAALLLASHIGLGIGIYFPSETRPPPFPAPKLALALYPVIIFATGCWPRRNGDLARDNQTRDADATK